MADSAARRPPRRAAVEAPHSFGVETIYLDLAPLAGSLGQRLRDVGLPVTPERSVEFARALTLTRPESRRRLYWTARSVFVTDRAEVPSFEAVFAEIFGSALNETAPPEEFDNAGTEHAAADDRTATERRGTSKEGRGPGSVGSAATGDADDPDSREVDVPIAMASDEEVLAAKSFDLLAPHELARLYRLMSQLELATPERRTRRYDHGSRGQRTDLRRTLRRSLRTAGDPIHLGRDASAGSCPAGW